MSLTDGMAAFNLQMPKKIPRTEYSIEMHFPYLTKLTGLDLYTDSVKEVNRLKARQILFEKWNYGFLWNVAIGEDLFENYRTKMGHALYMENAEDYSNNVICPFNSSIEVLNFDFHEYYQIPKHQDIVDIFNNHYNTHCSLYPNLVNTTGIYVTLISGLIAIFGWEMMLEAMGEDPEGFGEVANRYAEFIKPYFDALADADCPVAKIHDDIVWTSGPFVNPKWYRKYVFPNYEKLFAPIIESGKKILYTSDGTYDMFFEDIAKAGADGFVLEPSNDLKYCCERFGKTHAIVGAVDTRVLLSGIKDDIFQEVKRNIDYGHDCPGYFLAVGNHIPPNTPISSVEWYQEAYEEYSIR